MKKFLFSALVLATLAVGLTRASAQVFAGFDDFNTTSDAKWAYFFRTNGSGTSNGDLAFSGTQLDFSKSAGAGSYFLGWLGTSNPLDPRNIDSYTTSWVSEISVTSNFSSLAVGSDFLAVGIEVAGGAGQFSSIMLNTNTAGNFIRTEGSGTTVNQVSSPSSTDVRLRLSWDATTKLLVSSFSTDSGSNYTNLTTFTPDTQWTGSTQGTNGFFFEVWVNSNATAAVTVGGTSLDNFSVVAVPEPSTYALLAAGLGLVGFGAWRRRRAA